MRTLKITRATLTNFGACSGGVADFIEAYPRGVTITDNQRVNADRLAPLWAVVSGGCDCKICKPHLDGNAQGNACTLVEWLCYRLGLAGSYQHDSDLFLAAGLLADAVGVYLTRKRKR